MNNSKMYTVFLLLAILASVATATFDFSVDLNKLNQSELQEIHDVSVRIKTGMVTYDNNDSNKTFITGYNPQKPNQVISTKIVNLTNHLGTHVDAPAHVDEKLLGTCTTDKIDLAILNGPALVMQVPEGSNLTAEVLQSLNIPRGVKRVLFRTDNSDKDLLGKTYFTSNYTAFTPDGARWLVENTDIKLLGTDYISAGTRETIYPTHKVLLAPEYNIVPLETLDLRKISPGWYMIYCLPLNLEGIDGAPTRCMLTPLKI